MNLQDKNVVVTGGGGGVGRELVLRLLQKGAKVVAVDINEAALKETAEVSGNDKNLSIYVTNITDNEAVLNLANEVKERIGHVDVVVNNAGIIQPFITINELNAEQINRVMNVNFYGTLNMVKAFLPELLQRPAAHIVNVSSMGGFLPVPGQVAYGASKAAVKLLSEGLNSELRDTNVNVSVIIPGGIATDIMKNSNVKREVKTKGAKNKIKLLTPGEAAEMILKAIEKNKNRMYIGKDSKSMNLLYKFIPKTATNMINKALG